MSAENTVEARILRLNERLKKGTLVTSFDLDQVLRNTAKSVVAEFNRRFEDNKRFEDIKKWWQLTPWLIEKGLSEEQARKAEIDLWENPEVLSQAEPIYGAMLFFQTLTTLSFGRTHIITSSPPRLRSINLAWCLKYFSGNRFFMPEQIWIRDNENNNGEDFKIEKVKAVGAHMHIDDSLQTALRVRDETSAHSVLIQSTESLSEGQIPEGISIVPRRPDGQVLLDVYALLVYGKIFPEL